MIWPDALIPVVSVSPNPSLDPAFHLALGAALTPLRDQGVLIIGSGASYHGQIRGGGPVSETFDGWLRETMDAARNGRLARWTAAPQARAAHPREEHLIPLMVAAGAGPADPAALMYSAKTLGLHYSAWAFGEVSTGSAGAGPAAGRGARRS